MTSVHSAGNARILLKECHTLASAGFDVTLVAQGERPDAAGAVRFVPVRRPTGRVDRMLRTTRDVFLAAARRRADVYHFHDPELIPVGLALKAMGAKVVYDVHEDLPRQVASKEWVPPALRPVVSGLAAIAEWVAGQAFDGIVAVTPSIAARFPRQRTILVRNFPIDREFDDPEGAAPYAERAPLVAFVGNATAIRGLRELVAAMDLLHRQPDARLVIAGRIEPTAFADELARTAGWDRVSYLGWLDRASVSELLATARVGVVTFLPAPNHVEAYPTKLFEYMAAGLPVVASDFPTWREFVIGNACGILADPTDPQEIANAIETVLDDPELGRQMGQNGRTAVTTAFSWSHEGAQLISLMDRLTLPHA